MSDSSTQTIKKLLAVLKKSRAAYTRIRDIANGHRRQIGSLLYAESLDRNREQFKQLLEQVGLTDQEARKYIAVHNGGNSEVQRDH